MCDVRHPSVCCEYVLLSFLNKEADLAKGKGEYRYANPNRDTERRKAESRSCHEATREVRCQRISGKS